jgi:formate hydrogenlyase subunit 6/NADH:ubiquinone oxidoreductase subunit I
VAIKVYKEEKKIEYHPFKCLYCYLCIETCMQQAITGSDFVQEPAYTKIVKVFETDK